MLEEGKIRIHYWLVLLVVMEHFDWSVMIVIDTVMDPSL